MKSMFTLCRAGRPNAASAWMRGSCLAVALAGAACSPKEPDADAQLDTARLDTIQRLSANAPAATQFANTGKVLSTIDTDMYTYIEVSHNGATRWLAASKITLEKGVTIGYAAGAQMPNFHSKVLQRTFQEITFVESVVPIEADN